MGSRAAHGPWVICIWGCRGKWEEQPYKKKQEKVEGVEED